MPQISIIVPVYKVEQYLKKCVDSILAQTFTDFELILVDDGSPDNCGAICDEYAGQDSRVKVIHKKNGGLSDARNAGIDIAEGEYITFIDSDDCIVQTMYESLYHDIIKESADIAIGGVLKDTGEINGYFVNGKYYIQNGKDALCTLLWSKDASITAWGKLYKTSIFNDIRYPKGITPEDVFVIGDIMLKAEKVVFDIRGMYIYLIRNDSISNSAFNRKLEENRYFGYVYNLELAEKLASDAVPLIKYRLWWCSRSTLTALALASKEVKKENSDLQKKHSKLLRNDWRRIILCKYTPFKIKIVSLIGAFLPCVYGIIARIFIK